MSKEFILFCKANSIHRELTAPYIPEQNGVAERKNHTVMEMTRSLLQAKGLSNQFWVEAVATSVYLLNLSPTRAVMNQTPFEAWRGTKIFVSHFRVFGCIAYALVNSQVRQKLDENFEKCIFVGHCTQSKAYRLFNPLSGKIVISKNVVFDKTASWNMQGINEKMQQQIPLSNGISQNESQEPTPTNSPAGSSMASPSSSTTTPSQNSLLKSLRTRLHQENSDP